MKLHPSEDVEHAPFIMSPHPPPATITPAQRWIAVDSDGCVFDSMRPKHEHCFAPALVETWGLRGMESLVLEAFIHLNLFSKNRGANRFLALSLFWPWLAAHGGDRLPSMERFLAWTRSGGALSESGLAAARAAHPADEGLMRAAAWSQRIDELVGMLPPPAVFDEAVPTLAMIAGSSAMLYVVSSGTRDTIEAEWREANLARHAADFFTQENGGKARALSVLCARHGGERGLMVGDSLADMNAAREAGTAFFPIEPGNEAASWRFLREQVVPAYLQGGHAAVDSAGGAARLAAHLGLNAKASLQFL